jgi:hypothetical protein
VRTALDDDDAAQEGTSTEAAQEGTSVTPNRDATRFDLRAYLAGVTLPERSVA